MSGETGPVVVVDTLVQIGSALIQPADS